jgi:hypothetical protein
MMGGVLAGVGVGGLVSTFASGDAARALLEQLAKANAENQDSIKTVLFDHLGQCEDDLQVPDSLRAKLHTYHQTSVDDIVIWVYSEVDFSKATGLRRLTCQVVQPPPQGGGPEQVYSISVTCRRQRLIYVAQNINDPYEVAGIKIFDSPSFLKTMTGFLFHMDWDNRLRISRSILSYYPLIVIDDPDSIQGESAAALDRIWIKESGRRYRFSFGIDD